MAFPVIKIVAKKLRNSDAWRLTQTARRQADDSVARKNRRQVDFAKTHLGLRYMHYFSCGSSDHVAGVEILFSGVSLLLNSRIVGRYDNVTPREPICRRYSWRLCQWQCSLSQNPKMSGPEKVLWQQVICKHLQLDSLKLSHVFSVIF